MLFRQPKTELIAGLDIGSSAVRIAVGQVGVDARGRQRPQEPRRAGAEVQQGGRSLAVTRSRARSFSSASVF